MIGFLTTLGLRLGVPQRVAGFAGGAVALVLLLTLLSLGKCAYDRSIVHEHEATIDARNTKAGAEANEAAAADRRRDDARNRNHQQELDDARSHPSDTRRRIERGCAILRQQGRAETDLPERCRP